MRNINHTSFAVDITKSLADSNIQELDLDSSVALYNVTMSDVLDKHASLMQKKVADCPTVSWFNKFLSDKIRLKRRLENHGNQTTKRQLNTHTFTSKDIRSPTCWRVQKDISYMGSFMKIPTTQNKYSEYATHLLVGKKTH